MQTVTDFIFLAPKSLQMVTAAMKVKDTYSFRRKAVTSLDSILERGDITLLTKSIQSKLWFFQWSCMDVRVGL